ncbi:type II toxin-antitoxin system PemK/MazF family toxin [Aerophototrophica crusticola]|uniref:Type II toxin-antitoxin system PemK/MazF family toxin n=1 Tax=Aerophototrophica crusticola TaxID=1709002 RepID=A0A858RAS3_9PROT|nr:type II toxin-antitoxin system PemK/MazF family toxin [Rhodospirillaceae bacterium B3]
MAPKVGQVVVHHFLWFEEQTAGLVEGRKPRPCVIIAVEPDPAGTGYKTTVLPITSRKPRADAHAVAVPPSLKRTLGLDQARDAWVIVDDANVFTWPGFDLVPQAGGGFARGLVTAGFFQQLREAVLLARGRGRPRRIDRDS